MNARGHWIMAAALVGVLAVAVAPLPPMLFDLLIGISVRPPPHRDISFEDGDRPVE